MKNKYSLLGIAGGFLAGVLTAAIFVNTEKFYVGDVNSDKMPDVVQTRFGGTRIYLQTPNGELVDYNTFRNNKKKEINKSYNDKIREEQLKGKSMTDASHLREVRKLEISCEDELLEVDRKYHGILSNALDLVDRVGG